jgi:CRISPR system Cascade subunit CasA
MHDLLTEALIRVRMPEGRQEAQTLPGVLEALTRDGVEGFVGLQAHQHHAWYAFLVQLAALAIGPDETAPVPKDEAGWRDLLRGLTADHGGDAPWSLVVKDLSLPAFFQPPVPEGTLEKFSAPLYCPDEIDVLVTSKNHDVKMARMAHPHPDQWVYALVSLQTMQGFLGRGNYGIARMNGGFASRSCVSLTPSLRWGVRFLRDLRVLRSQRRKLLEEHPHYPLRGGLGLVWLDPWDGKESLSLSSLDPYFIECCRRVRYQAKEGVVVARLLSSKVARIAAKELNGNTGDPWAPVRISDHAALTVSAKGFSYDQLAKYLFSGEFQPGICLLPYPEDGKESLFLVASALVRGQGTTDGVHRRVLPLPSKVRGIFGGSGEDRLGKLSKERVEDANVTWRKLLRTGLLHLLQGGPEKVKGDDDRVDAWRPLLDGRVDEIFFPQLWEALDLEADKARETWRRTLVGLAWELLLEAPKRAPIPAVRRLRAEAAAERVFWGAAQRHMEIRRSDLKNDTRGETHDCDP